MLVQCRAMLAASSLLLASPVPAAVVDFDFGNAATGATSVPASSQDPNVLVLSDLSGNPTLPPGLAAKVLAGTADGNAFGGQGWRNQGQYYSFEIQASANHDLTLSRLSLDGLQAPAGLLSWQVQVNIGNGTTIVVPAGNVLPSTAGSDQFVAFSGPQFSHLTAPVTIQIYSPLAAQDNGHPWIIDNVALDGTVQLMNVVPEPAAWGLVAVAGLSVLAWRHRARSG